MQGYIKTLKNVQDIKFKMTSDELNSCFEKIEKFYIDFKQDSDDESTYDKVSCIS